MYKQITDHLRKEHKIFIRSAIPTKLIYDDLCTPLVQQKVFTTALRALKSTRINRTRFYFDTKIAMYYELVDKTFIHLIDSFGIVLHARNPEKHSNVFICLFDKCFSAGTNIPFQDIQQAIEHLHNNHSREIQGYYLMCEKGQLQTELDSNTKIRKNEFENLKRDITESIHKIPAIKDEETTKPKPNSNSNSNSNQNNNSFIDFKANLKTYRERLNDLWKLCNFHS
jgi:hypothetical protein